MLILDTTEDNLHTTGIRDASESRKNSVLRIVKLDIQLRNVQASHDV
jgi:hypothetical protein